jgi:RHS repeat-associated protein
VQLNLRFPGQYADAESGTHYNLMRDYDPHTGRYLTPDPLGLYDGVNLFAYVHNNPVSGIDRLGLYDQMVHYYMTYFLALVAGLPQDVARMMAIADQYVDENELTEPIHYVVWPHSEALPLYHFVMNYADGYNGDVTKDPVTRIESPRSDQLSNLYNSTNAQRLQELWIQSHLTGIPGLCPYPSPADINNARYQLYGEYLHAFEDTFAHRDAYNMSYGMNNNIYNTPDSWAGHGGPGVPDWFGHAPDHTYNQNYRSKSVCVIPADRIPIVMTDLSREECTRLGGDGYEPANDADPTVCAVRYILGGEDQVEGLTESECAAREQEPGVGYTTFHPGTGKVWAYNELRTLRMEYEVFNNITSEFGNEIARNLEAGGQKFTWQDIAGRAEWDESHPEKNARIGSAQSFEEWAQEEGHPKDGVGTLYGLGTVLQQYNASNGSEESRLKILNDWLAEHEIDQIEPRRQVAGLGESLRISNIGWIPHGNLPGVLLPPDPVCGNSGC